MRNNSYVRWHTSQVISIHRIRFLKLPRAGLSFCAQASRLNILLAVAIRRAELTDGKTSMTAANDLAVRRALEMAGVEFIDENGGGPGVRLRKRQGLKKPK